MNNVHCRMAVEYAANKTSQQTAYGGPVTGGQIASTVAPPNIIGQKHFDYYEATTRPGGALAKARAQLKLCGRPNRFSTGIAYRSDRPKESAGGAVTPSLTEPRPGSGCRCTVTRPAPTSASSRARRRTCTTTTSGS
jgi:hypothetical protein